MALLNFPVDKDGKIPIVSRRPKNYGSSLPLYLQSIGRTYSSVQSLPMEGAWRPIWPLMMLCWSEIDASRSCILLELCADGQNSVQGYRTPQLGNSSTTCSLICRADKKSCLTRGRRGRPDRG